MEVLEAAHWAVRQQLSCLDGWIWQVPMLVGLYMKFNERGDINPSDKYSAKILHVKILCGLLCHRSWSRADSAMVCTNRPYKVHYSP